MLFTGVMVMIMMATACVLSFPEVVEEEVAAVVVVVGEWDPRGQGMVPPPDAPSTGLWCQVGDVFLPLRVVLISLCVLPLSVQMNV